MRSLSLLLSFLLLLLLACSPRDREVSVIFQSEDSEEAACPDLEELEQNGEIIGVTLSGPDTYFEFRGQSFGLQYDLIADFARSQGLRIRMEIAHDTLELLRLLQDGEADVIALPLEEQDGFVLTAIQDSSVSDAPLGWITRQSSVRLADALNAWYSPSVRERVIAQQKQRTQKQKKRSYAQRQHPRPKMKDAANGVISDYDHLFRTYATTCSLDWRLLAAQCYQESAFDPNAVSWAGAQGLMQMMPSTASHYGITGQVFDPEANIHAAARMLRDLNSSFSDISDSDERLSFVLASYNGGSGHVRDAMMLARKYGADSHSWTDVRQYLLLLSDAKYYRDADVRCGYINGSETVNYVDAIRSHWKFYVDHVAR